MSVQAFCLGLRGFKQGLFSSIDNPHVTISLGNKHIKTERIADMKFHQNFPEQPNCFKVVSAPLRLSSTQFRLSVLLKTDFMSHVVIGFSIAHQCPSAIDFVYVAMEGGHT